MCACVGEHVRACTCPHCIALPLVWVWTKEQAPRTLRSQPHVPHGLVHQSPSLTHGGDGGVHGLQQPREHAPQRQDRALEVGGAGVQQAVLCAPGGGVRGVREVRGVRRRAGVLLERVGRRTPLPCWDIVRT